MPARDLKHLVTCAANPPGTREQSTKKSNYDSAKCPTLKKNVFWEARPGDLREEVSTIKRGEDAASLSRWGAGSAWGRTRGPIPVWKLYSQEKGSAMQWF